MKKTKNKLLVVEDFKSLNDSLEKGKITQEEYDAVFKDARKTGLMNTKEGVKFGRILPFAMGGSDTGPVCKVSSWTSRRMLQLKKLGLVEETLLPGRQFIFDFGHIFERAVGTMGALMLREKGLDVVYVPCDYGYVHTAWPHFLAHPDGFLVDRKTGRIVALAEVKTSSKDSPHWSNGFAIGVVPDDYLTQVQAYMQVLGLDQCYVLAWNCTRSEDGFAQILVKRDEKRAIKILDECEKFVKDTEAGVEYEDDLFPSEAAVVFRKEDKSLGYVPLPKEKQAALERLNALSMEKSELLLATRETGRLIRQIEAEEKTLKGSLLTSIGCAPGGILETSDATYRVDVSRGFSFDADVKKIIAEKHPRIWKEITSIKPTLSAKLIVTSKDLEDAE